MAVWVGVIVHAGGQTAKPAWAVTFLARLSPRTHPDLWASHGVSCAGGLPSVGTSVPAPAGYRWPAQTTQ
jgi:hypothetical protein